MPTSSAPTKRRVAAVTEPMVCVSCSTVPFGALNLVSLLAAICCVLAVLVILSSVMLETEQAQFHQVMMLAQHPAPVSTVPTP